MNGSEVSLRRLVELSCDWYWILDAQWRLEQLEGRDLEAGPNPMQAQLGKPPWQWPGVLVDAADFAQLRNALLHHQFIRELEYTLRDHRGHLCYLALWGEPVFDRDGSFAGYRGTTRDVTQRKRAEALRTLEHSVTRNLAEAATRRKILQAVMRVICESEQWDTAGFFRVEDKQGTTRLVTGWSGPGMAQAAVDYYKQTNDKVIPSGGLLSRVVASAKPLWVDAMTEAQTTWAQRVQRTGERATFFCPVLVDSEVFGVFAFASREIREPDELLLQTLRVICEQVGQFLKRKEAEQVLRESEARFRALTELSSDWYWEIDADFRFTRIEGRHAGTGESQPGEGAIGKQCWETGLEFEDAGGWAAHRLQLEAQQPFRDVVMTSATADGARRYISISGEPMRDQRSAFVGYRGVGRDVTERKLAENHIRQLATHDGLTGLPNRVLFSELLAVAIRSAERHRQSLAVLFIDLDLFKVVNDTLGHDAGDALLKEMAQRFKDCLRSSDVVARMGGDEFVVLLQGVDGSDDAAPVARKILSAAARPVPLQGRDYRVTASVGISLFGEDASDEQTLMQNADVAMYAAKQNGRNSFQFYSREIALRSSHRLGVENHLRGALERGELFLQYLAKVDLQCGAIIGVEALLRWCNPELGSVPPAQFMPLAEETGLILQLGKWVLRHACQQCLTWQGQGLPPLTMSVSLSAKQFADEFLLADIAVVLHETGLAPDLLELKITEAIVLQNVVRAVKVLEAIKGIGVRLAIDDFGTGYSPLGQLKTLPMDTLKIDRSFVHDLPASAADNAIIEAIIGIGKTLGSTILLEGVETKEHHSREQARDQAPGYRFAEPISANEFVELWRQYSAPDFGGASGRSASV